MRYANAISTWLAILAVAISGGLYVGGVAADTTANKTDIVKTQQQVDKLRDDGPPAIARLEAQVKAVQDDVADIKDSQKDILSELRKK